MNQENENNTFSLREFVQLLQDYLKEFKRSLPLMIWVLLPVGAYFAYQQFTKKPQYTAKVSFMLNEA